jgi:4-alpha-glucanotransferase
LSELPPAVAALAAVHGVATEYWDWQGQFVQVPPATVHAVLAALGVDSGTPEAARASLAEHELDRWRRALPACLVVRQGQGAWFAVHVPHGRPVELAIELEGGTEGPRPEQQQHWVDPRYVDGRLVGEATFALPTELPLGWHALRLRSTDPDGRVDESSAPLVVTPQRIEPAVLREGERAWGILAQLYSLRSCRSWGIGDLADLADLAAWSGHELGAGFVLVNPLHAASPLPPMEPSPYLPVTRRFANPLYLRVEEIPEHAYLDPAAAERVAMRSASVRAAASGADRLDRDTSWAAKRESLEELGAAPLSVGRAAAFDAFRASQGQGLRDFATWCALVEEHGWPWQSWPAELHDAHGPGVARERERLRARVEHHERLQWWLDEQLAHAQSTARAVGMSIGVVHDLAVGVHPQGADTWAHAGVLAAGVSVGAPPDAFNQQGQDWSQPPWRPGALADAGYAPYRDMLRTVLRHAGGLRVDHVLGLFRLWWIPQGRPPTEGTYVRSDHEALVGILALEAQRAGAVVVGEDLGTVDPWVRDVLLDRGIAGTSILWFERDASGRPLPAERWRSLCLATVTTHDLPPTAGYLAGEHLRIRAELGLLTRPVEEVRALDVAEKAAWLAELADRGLLDHDAAGVAASVDATVEALHRYLARTPSLLLGVSLSDLAGDRRAQNQPGTTDEYPNWRQPLAGPDGRPVLLEDLARSDRARALARAVGGRVRPAVG